MLRQEVQGAGAARHDLAWPNGIQEELSQPVAVLLNEGKETIAIARSGGLPVLHHDPGVSALFAGGDSGRGTAGMILGQIRLA